MRSTPASITAWLDAAKEAGPDRHAAALVAAGRYGEAQTAAEGAIAAEPHDPRGYNVLGVVYSCIDDLHRAQACFGAAIAVDPSFAVAAGNLGEVLVKLGDIDRALTYFERARDLEPGNGTHHLRLINARLGVTDRAHLRQMERLLDGEASMPPESRVDLHFALARALERSHDYDAAFRHFAAANELKRGRITYGQSARMHFFASLQAAFSDAFIDAFRGCGDPSARPIFIVGMPRSGSTLVEQLLAAIPGVAAAGEVSVFEEAIGAELMRPGMSLDDVRAAIAAVGTAYLRATGAIAGDAVRVTDKMLYNFCFLPLIYLALPNARVIHVHRNALDTCFSCYATNFTADGLAYTADLGELGRYYAAYEELTATWRARLPADYILDVRYEALVDDFETHARRIVEFCGLPWDPKALAFHDVRRTVRTASNVQVRQPLYHNAVGRSRYYERFLGPLIDALGPARALR